MVAAPHHLSAAARGGAPGRPRSRSFPDSTAAMVSDGQPFSQRQQRSLPSGLSSNRRLRVPFHELCQFNAGQFSALLRLLVVLASRRERRFCASSSRALSFTTFAYSSRIFARSAEARSVTLCALSLSSILLPALPGRLQLPLRDPGRTLGVEAVVAPSWSSICFHGDDLLRRSAECRCNETLCALW